MMDKSKILFSKQTQKTILFLKYDALFVEMMASSSIQMKIYCHPSCYLSDIFSAEDNDKGWQSNDKKMLFQASSIISL